MAERRKFESKKGGILVILEKIENSAVLFVRRDLE